MINCFIYFLLFTVVRQKYCKKRNLNFEDDYPTVISWIRHCLNLAVGGAQSVNYIVKVRRRSIDTTEEDSIDSPRFFVISMCSLINRTEQ